MSICSLKPTATRSCHTDRTKQGYYPLSAVNSVLYLDKLPNTSTVFYIPLVNLEMKRSSLFKYIQRVPLLSLLQNHLWHGRQLLPALLAYHHLVLSSKLTKTAF